MQNSLVPRRAGRGCAEETALKSPGIMLENQDARGFCADLEPTRGRKPLHPRRVARPDKNAENFTRRDQRG